MHYAFVFHMLPFVSAAYLGDIALTDDDIARQIYLQKPLRQSHYTTTKQEERLTVRVRSKHKDPLNKPTHKHKKARKRRLHDRRAARKTLRRLRRYVGGHC